MFNMATKKVGIKHMKSNYKTISKELREFKEYSTTNSERFKNILQEINNS